MLDKKETQTMLFILECMGDKDNMILPAQDIARQISKNNVVSLANISEIMLSLRKEDYLDFVTTATKSGRAYCIKLLNKAKTFRHDLKKQKRATAMLVARTVLLAVLSFVVGAILKAIF